MNETINEFNGLTTVNVELTSKCNKNCWMCGRRKIDREYPEISSNYGDMKFELVEKIAQQLPQNIVVQLHNNGEPLLYPRFGEATKLFQRQITSIDTNGKLLVEKAEEIIGNIDTMAISVFEKDVESEEQYELIKEFLKKKGTKKPLTLVRLNGDVNPERYEKLGLTVISRTLHSPMGSFNYRKPPTIPEIGICLDFLNHIAISKDGDVSICVRFDPKKLGVLGNVNEEKLKDIWNGEKRMRWLELHKQGKRSEIPLCSYCHFWGVPTGEYQSKKEHIDEKKVLDNKE